MAEKGTPYIGRAMKRVEDPRLVKGIGTYTDDLRLPGMLHASILRSPHAHARILRIDTGAAKALSGVVAVFTGDDVNDSCGAVPCAAAIPDLKGPMHTVLAGDRVYFVGHAVAVAVATDPYVARDAIEAIDVDYDPLPVVTNPEEAIKSGTPLTHPDLGTNVAFTHSVSGGSDIDEAFRRADRVIRHRLYHQRLTPMPIEPRACVASYHAGEGTLTLWTATQIPHLLRTLLPAMIGDRREQAAGRRPRGRRWFRREAQRVRGGGALRASRHAIARTREMGRVAPRKRRVDHSRPRSDRRLRSRGEERRFDSRHQVADGCGSRRVQPAADADGAHADGARPHRLLSHSRREDRHRRGVHAQDVDGRLSRRRPARSDVLDRAAHGRHRARGRRRPSRASSQAFSVAERLPVCDLVRSHVRQRQLSGRAGEGEAAGRLGSADERSIRRARRGTAGGRGRLDLRRNLCDGTLGGHGRGRLGVGLRADGNLRKSDRHHGRVAARPGPGDELRADHGGPPRRCRSKISSCSMGTPASLTTGATPTAAGGWRSAARRS